jgi:hypothetical protein
VLAHVCNVLLVLEGHGGRVARRDPPLGHVEGPIPGAGAVSDRA